MAGTILLMDNIEDALNKWGSLLEEVGYDVIKASTLEEAENALKNKWVHLAILDIRMVDEDDENDISGLLLAQKPEFVSIPKIILTSYPSFEYARLVLADIDGQRSAINFIAKAEGPRKLIVAIEQAFADQVRINSDLEIQWKPDEPLSFLYLVGLTQPDKNVFMQRADELEDLFRRLFYKDQKIRMGRLLWNNRRQFCISILAQSVHGAAHSHILVCGDRQQFEHGQKIIEALTSQTAQGTIFVNTSETMHFRANLYRCPGTDIETIQTLQELLQMGKERPLKTAFANLLGDVLKEWHQHGQMVQGKQDLMFLYRQWTGLIDDQIFRTQLEQRLDGLIESTQILERIEIKRKDRQITFHFPGQPPNTFPDPLAAVYAPLTQYDAPVVCRVSPGKLKAENILVDSEQRPWLTDFANAGQAPECWDFVCLEAALRFESSQAPDFMAWLDFEKCLMQPSSLDERLEQTDVIQELRTNVALIEQIRRQAANEASPNLIPYYAGLLAWVVEAMSHYDPDLLSTKTDRLQNAHLLLAASMLAKRLGLGTILDDAPTGGDLQLDDDDRLLIGERYIATFSGFRLKLLRCLYEHAGQSVSIQTIVETVYDEEYDPKDRDQPRIRQEITRLRQEIEPNLSHPRYILTVRNKGYRLELSGKPQK